MKHQFPSHIIRVLQAGNGNEYGIKCCQKYDSRLLKLVNDELKNQGKATVKGYDSKRMIEYHIGHYDSCECGKLNRSTLDKEVA